MDQKRRPGPFTAVLDGLRRSKRDVLVTDADLSHPPEKIPELLAALREGPEFVVGSRTLSVFFALRRETFESGRDFNPVGYKIGLELLVKCRCKRAVEVPIHFSDRRFGKSKLSLKEQLRYLCRESSDPGGRFGDANPCMDVQP